MTAIPRPIILQHSQQEAAVDLLTRAFVDDVGYIFVIPDREERARWMQRYWRALLAHVMSYGEIYTTASLDGIVCWLPPGRTTASLWQFLRTGFALPRAFFALRPPSRERMSAAMRHNDQVHQQVMKGPHWYLGALAVDPDRQHRGIGSQLVRPVLERADAQNMPCFLETQSEGNVRFYERLGFRVACAGEVPGNGLRMWAMTREPRS